MFNFLLIQMDLHSDVFIGRYSLLLCASQDRGSVEGGEIDCGVEKNSEVGKKSPVPGSTKRARGQSISFLCRKNARGVINFEHIPVRDHKNARGVQVFRFVFEKTRDGRPF